MSKPPQERMGFDVEVGNRQLYPMMQERPELRWAFIRKVYSIVIIQLFFTVAVSCVIMNVEEIKHFFANTPAGLGVYIAVVVSAVLVLIPLYFWRQRHPINFLLLMLFTILLSGSIGLACAFTSGMAVLQAVILTIVLVVSLSVYTFWAARRGKDFGFLGPFLFGSLMVLMVFSIIQIFFPLGKIRMIIGCIGVIVFSGYIVYDTDNLIKRYSYDEYIWASVCIYLDIVNLFLSLLSILRGGK